jgi:hypothetical protein
MDYRIRSIPLLDDLLWLREPLTRAHCSDDSSLRMLSLYKSQMEVNADAA